ncbi:hypothetical protein IMSAGC005_00235 [Lachnospiraceae bacterium]|nr:hypothetical protein IMSAGC005_00235 [Lachnospiraceae bacterium]
MVIDCHNHIGEPWGTRDRQTPEELLTGKNGPCGYRYGGGFSLPL